MFQYQEHELLCVISLHGASLTFKIQDIQSLDVPIENKSFSKGVLYNERTGITSEIRRVSYLKEKEDIKEGFIRIEDVVEEISDIYKTENDKNEIVRTNKKFFIITKYFEKCLNEVLESSRVPKEKLAFVFVLKDEWIVGSGKCPYSLGPGIADNLLKPLLQNAVSPHQNDSVKVLFMTQLEAFILYNQFSRQIKGLLMPLLEQRRHYELLKLIKSEKRCLMYTLINPGNDSTKLQLTYFQLVEDYNLRLFDEKYYIPKIEYIKNKSNFNSFNVKATVEQLVIRQYLNADHLFNTPQENYMPHPNNLKSTIIDVVFDNIIRRLEKNRQSNPFDRSRSTLEKHLTESQMKLLYSDELGDAIIKEIRKLSSTLLSEIAEYMEAENNKVPYFRKFIFLCMKGKNSPKEKILFIFLQELIEQHPMYNVPFKWCFFPVDPYLDDLDSGVAASVVRKTMIQNMELPPIIVEKHEELNVIGQPYFYSTDRGKKEEFFSPEHIICIDILIHRTDLVLETVNITHRWINDRPNLAIQDMNLPSFESFFESKLYSTSDTFCQPDVTLQEFLKELNTCQNTVDKLSKVALLKSYLDAYLKNILSYVNVQLENQNVQLESLGYVLSLEKVVMNALQMKSRTDLFGFLSRNNVIDLKENPRKLIVVDAGEKFAWYMLKEIEHKAAYYYIHSYISDSYIYLKLHQVIDVSDSNGTVTGDPPAIFIKDKTISIKNVYKHASEHMWNHIQSLTNREKDEFVHSVGATSIDHISDFKVFKHEFICFLKEKLFCDQNMQNNSNLYEATHRFKLSTNSSITTSIQQLIQIAIIPVIKCIVSDIITCLLDLDIFGHYDIALLIITGNCLSIKTFNEEYHRIVTQEMSKTLKELIREKTYRTKFKISVDTCKQGQPSPRIPSKQERFCYDIFTKGELRIVPSTTYFVSDKFNQFQEYFKIASPWKYVKSYSLVLRGHEYTEKRTRMMFLRKFDKEKGLELGNSYRNQLVVKLESLTQKIVLFKYTEPCNLQDITNAENLSEINPTTYSLTHQKIQFGDLVVIQIDKLFYRSCIRITCEKYSAFGGNGVLVDTKSFLFGERLTLKYV